MLLKISRSRLTYTWFDSAAYRNRGLVKSYETTGSSRSELRVKHERHARDTNTVAHSFSILTEPKDRNEDLTSKRLTSFTDATSDRVLQYGEMLQMIVRKQL